MKTDIMLGKNAKLTIEILCEDPCCEKPPCSPLTMGIVPLGVEKKLLMMVADPNCHFRYRMVYNKGLNSTDYFFFEHLGSQCYAQTLSKWKNDGGWPGWGDTEKENNHG